MVIDDEVMEYIADRDRAMFTHDPDEVRKLVVRWGKYFPGNLQYKVLFLMEDEELIYATHKMVLEMDNPPEDEETKSISWMLDNGYRVEAHD